MYFLPFARFMPSRFVAHKMIAPSRLQKKEISHIALFPLLNRLQLVVIGTLVLLLATACLSSPPDASSNSTVQPPANAINLGKLTGDSISLKKVLTCGVGCPEPLRVRIDTIQIDKTNSIMIWNVHFFAPTNTPNNGVANAVFPDFALQSNTTPLTQASQSVNTPGNLQAKFPFTPVPDEVYTLTLTASYQNMTNGIISIESTSQSYPPVTMSFKP